MVVDGLAWRRSSVWHGQAVVVVKSVFGGAREFPVAPANRASESGRRQALPAVLTTVVGGSGRWSGVLVSGLVLWPVVWCSGRWWPRHDVGVASATSECSALVSVGLGGSTASKGSEVVAVCA